MFFKKDIYRSLRPTPTERGWKFKNILDVEYSDALLYPRFKFLHADKSIGEGGIVETSDFKALLEIIGNTSLSVGATFSYKGISYSITDISVDVLDIVIDYSNGHTDYYIGRPIPFHIEIAILVEETSLYDLAVKHAEKYAALKEKENLTMNEKMIMSLSKLEAENLYEKMTEKVKNNAELYKSYGIFKSICEEHLEAISLFQKALEISPNNGALYFDIGYEYGLMDNEELAQTFMKKALSLGYKPAAEYLD